MKKEDVTKKEYLSVAETAEVMGYTRQHIVRLIQNGEITAQKVGRSFVIRRKDLPGLFSDLKKNEKSEIDRSVDRVFKHYEKALRQLGKE